MLRAELYAVAALAGAISLGFMLGLSTLPVALFGAGCAFSCG